MRFIQISLYLILEPDQFSCKFLEFILLLNCMLFQRRILFQYSQVPRDKTGIILRHFFITITWFSCFPFHAYIGYSIISELSLDILDTIYLYLSSKSSLDILDTIYLYLSSKSSLYILDTIFTCPLNLP